MKMPAKTIKGRSPTRHTSYRTLENGFSLTFNEGGMLDDVNFSIEVKNNKLIGLYIYIPREGRYTYYNPRGDRRKRIRFKKLEKEVLDIINKNFGRTITQKCQPTTARREG